MKIKLLSALAFSLLMVLSSATAITAQQDDKKLISAASNLYVISANAGGVNFVEGKVAVTRTAAKSGYLLKGDNLEVGDQVATGENGKAEILLNPGSFVRLAENSNFEFLTTSLDDLKLKLNRGSAIFEVITDAEFGFSVKTPQTVFDITKSGIYRVDVASDGSGKIEVWKGRAVVNNSEIKSGKQATVQGSQVAIVKFDRDEKDSLEIWSKERAKQLTKINARLQNSAMRTSLMRSFLGNRWNMFNSYGLWVYDSFSGGYCFLPFGYGWNSPYGYYYRRDIWQYRLPPVVYTQPQRDVTGPRLSAGSTANGNDRITRNSVGSDRITRNAEESAPVRLRPPYTRVQRDISDMPNLGDIQDTRRQDSYSPSFPVFVPSAPSQPQSAPVLAPPSGARKGGN